MEEQVRASPDDLQLAWALANIQSWQGSAAEQMGQLDLAARFFRGQVSELERIRQAEPELPSLQYSSVLAEQLLASALNLAGEYAEAEVVARTAAQHALALTELDPENADWRMTLMQARVTSARALFGLDRVDEAEALVAAVQPVLAETLAVHESDRLAGREAFVALSLETAMALRRGDLAAAAESSRRLAEVAGDGIEGTPVELGRRALAAVLDAELSARRGDPERGAARLAEAEALLAPIAADSRYWPVLDPWLRTRLLAGDP